MTIHVSKDVENQINAAVQGGLFASADEMIGKLVQDFASRTRQQPAASPPAPEQWVRQLQAWVDKHPSRPATIDDSRESIYAGRGE